jgi:cytochrome c oxidase cbb3-type subunit 3
MSWRFSKFSIAAVLAALGTVSFWSLRDGAAQGDNLPGLSGPFREVTVSPLSPGGPNTAPEIKNPMANDPGSAARGMQFFSDMNCIGCHAPNGGGGMGPALSNATWIYGHTPAQIYLTIAQGRPNGMPAFGQLLPDNVIWDLVTYIEGISEKPGTTYGTTTSLSPQSPKIEQVPAEMIQTTRPWDHTQPFSNGQRPPSSGAQ